MHVMRKWGRNQWSNLGCETARGLGGDTVTRWCYSNLFDRQSFAETEGLMSQSHEVNLDADIMCCRHPFACLWKAEWVRPRKPVKYYSGPRYKDGPLCTSEGVKWKSKFLGCTTERLFEWVSLSCCLNNGDSGSGWEYALLYKQFFLSHSMQYGLLHL